MVESMPPTEADDHVGEAVLAHVVAGAQHQRLVQLGVGRQVPTMRSGAGASCTTGCSLTRTPWAPAGWCTRPRGSSSRLRYTGSISTSVIISSSTNCAARAMQFAIGVEHHRAAVEHQLVLPAHLVHVHQRATGVGGTRGQHALAAGRLAGVERRAVDVDVQLGAAGRLMRERAGGAPHVFADADAHLHATDDVQLVRVVLVAGGEVAGLVEHRVVGQQPLAIRAHHLAVGAHGGSVVQIAVGVDEAHHRGTATCARRHLRPARACCRRRTRASAPGLRAGTR